MLALYERLARRLHGARMLVWVLAVLAIGAFATAVLLGGGDHDEAYMLLAVCVLLWSMCLLTVTYTFIHPRPEIAEDDGLLARIRIRTVRGLRWLMAWAMTAVGVIAAIATVRALLLAARDLGT